LTLERVPGPLGFRSGDRQAEAPSQLGGQTLLEASVITIARYPLATDGSQKG